ncbi:MAG TPA: hypothetical protein VGL53_28260 [Bryobacteraceae bacterium]|jgi:hypothetical protein
MKPMAVAILLVGLTGCHMFGKRKPAPVQTPAPPTPVAEVKPPPPKVEQPGPPPKIEAKVSDIPAAVDVIPIPPGPKPKHHKQPKKPIIAAPATTTPREGEGGGENVGTPPTSPVPKLGEILSDDQRLENLKICDESVGRAKQALAQLRGITLNASQKESVARIRTFISQAEQARQRDPQTARQLAERADLLSRDLVKTVR